MLLDVYKTSWHKAHQDLSKYHRFHTQTIPGISCDSGARIFLVYRSESSDTAAINTDQTMICDCNSKNENNKGLRTTNQEVKTGRLNYCTHLLWRPKRVSKPNEWQDRHRELMYAAPITNTDTDKAVAMAAQEVGMNIDEATKHLQNMAIKRHRGFNTKDFLGKCFNFKLTQAEKRLIAEGAARGENTESTSTIECGINDTGKSESKTQTSVITGIKPPEYERKNKARQDIGKEECKAIPEPASTYEAETTESTKSFESERGLEVHLKQTANSENEFDDERNESLSVGQHAIQLKDEPQNKSVNETEYPTESAVKSRMGEHIEILPHKNSEFILGEETKEQDASSRRLFFNSLKRLNQADVETRKSERTRRISLRKQIRQLVFTLRHT